ncbi:extracellular catalytic domain type 1 short-chain-length polyhydroxyalkanoate depolymerase [Brevundimonas variabilis]|uniref:Feruloyl esterase n=1 Tax=Brevundimonas variabilis TaxID=74312 RepID=A0A7W9FGQ7_9CAUL|nr:PHB depolymerase family esterase [Brevundimonas variabilis]MBB5746699.1 feruloyl esterase [Brevundimonas variabilis]
MTSLGQTVAALTRRRREAARSTGTQNTRMTAVALSSNPGDLRMLVHVPESLAPGAPLVVVLHGCTQTGEAYAAGAGWLALADRFGFVVLAPEQVPGNNPNRCFNWFQAEDTARGRGEAASIAAMTRQVIGDHGIDPARVFVTGLSAGGAMTAAMLASYPDLYVGGAIIAGLPFGAANTLSEAMGAMMQPRAQASAVWGDRVRQASPHTGPWPSISIWHGDADATVRPASADALIQQWTDVHGLTGGPQRARTPDGRLFDVWLSPDGQPRVEHHRISGLQHGTPLRTDGPDGVGIAGPFLIDIGISSSLEIALGWGIAQTEPGLATGSVPHGRTDRAPPQAAKETPSETAPTRSPSPRADGLTTVIENALKAAGLMR